jgi:hypothetical protein
LANAGAQLVAVLTIAASPATLAAATQRALPSAPRRAMPPVRPAGLLPVTVKPKKTLPALSQVSGVLMKTLAS